MTLPIFQSIPRIWTWFCGDVNRIGRFFFLLVFSGEEVKMLLEATWPRTVGVSRLGTGVVRDGQENK